MRIIKLVLFLIIFFKATYCKGQWGQPYSGQCVSELVSPAFTKTCNSNPWILAFEDNFDGNQIDLSKWDVKEGVIRDFSGKNEEHWLSKSNIEINNGHLRILTTRNVPAYLGTYTDWSNTPPTSESKYFDYSTGEIWTDSLFGYGKYEIRAKIPNGKGFWPAFWTFGGIGWNEIDIFEFYTDNTYEFITNTHYYHNQSQSNTCQHVVKCFSHLFNNCPDFSTQFHTFTMIWDFFKVEWYVDGNLVRQAFKFHTLLGQSIDCNSFSPFTQYIYNKAFPIEDMHIVLNTAVLTGNLAPAPDASTSFPGVFEIDYIRYWRKEPIPTPCNNGILKMYPFSGTYVGDNGLLLFAASVESGNYADITVQNELHILPNFKAKNGSYFHAKADPVACGTSARMANEEGDSTSTYERPPNLEKEDEEETIASSNQNTELLIFPNPTNGFINIELNSNKPYFEIEVFSLLGELIYVNKVNSSKLSFDLSQYPKGMYLVKIKQDNRYYHEKISYY